MRSSNFAPGIDAGSGFMQEYTAGGGTLSITSGDGSIHLEKL